MTDLVRVPAGDNISDTATLLLAAAEAKGNDFTVADVLTNTMGPGFAFVVPAELAKAAGLDGEPFGVPDGSVANVEQTTETAQAAAEAPKAPAKKTAKKAPARKRAAAKKTTAKKAAAKKTAAKA